MAIGLLVRSALVLQPRLVIRAAPFTSVAPRAFASVAPRAFASSVRMQSSASLDVSKYYTQPRPEATKDYVMQQTMIRVKDPAASLAFYCDVLGFNLVMHREFPQWEFNVYFVAQIDPANIPSDPEGQWRLCMNTPGCIELTYNYGSEAKDGLVYNTGNSDATGSKDGLPVQGGFGTSTPIELTARIPRPCSRDTIQRHSNRPPGHHCA